MTITQSSTRFVLATIGAAAIVAVALSASFATPAHAAVMCPGTTWARSLTVGSTGADVMALQQYLNMSAATQVAASGVGSPGMETNYFGAKTKAAVAKYQMAHSIAPTAGFFGPLTRASVNAACAGSVVTPGPTPGPSGTSLVVSAGAQPANGLAPNGTSRIPFTVFSVTAPTNGDVVLNSVTVQRTGVANDAAFSGVELLDSNGLQIGISKTLNSNHQSTIGAPVTIKAGQTMTFTVAANRGSTSSYAGQIASFSVIAVNTSAAVQGSLPITGASHTINETLTIGSVTINTSSFDPNSAGSQPIGTTAYRFTGLRITAGSAEDLTLKSITWNQSGSAGSSDLGNVVTVVGGTSYPTVVSADGKYYTTLFPNGIVIGKGNSIDVYVQGDVVGSGAANRVAEFDIYKNTDLYLTGNLYGYGVAAAAGSNTASTAGTHATTINTSSNPWLQGSTLSITAGSASVIQNASSVQAQNIALNVSNQVLGGFQTTILGEPVSVQGMYFYIATSSGQVGQMTSVSLVDQNGSVVAGPVDVSLGDGSSHGGSTATATNYNLVHFTDSVTLPVGMSTYTLKGKLPSTFVNNGTVVLSTKPSTDWTTPVGQTTGNSISLPSTVVTMNTMTVKSALLTVANSSNPTSQNIVAGGNGVLFANLQLDASQSGEDIRLSSIPLLVSAYGGAAVTDLSACQLWNGTTALNTGSRVINSSNINNASSGSPVYTTFTFDNSLTVPKGTVVTLSLRCNVLASVTAGSYNISADTTKGDYSPTGSISGNSVSGTALSVPSATSSAPSMTVAAGTLAFSTDPSSPSYTITAGGSTGVTNGVFKVRAANEAINLTKLALTLTNTGSSSAADMTQVYVYAGANIWSLSGTAVTPGTLLGTVTFTGTATVATSTLSMSVQLPKDQDATLLIKADFADIGTSQPGTEGDLVALNYQSAQGSGAFSGVTREGSGSTSVAGTRMFNTFPTIAADTLSSTGVADGKLMRFKVTADSHGIVGISKFAFSLATTTLSVTNVGLYAYTDSAYSQAISGQGSSGQIGTTTCSSANSNQCVSAPTLSFFPSTNPVEVPAGTTWYFELRGSVSGSASGASAVTTLLGDAGYNLNGGTTANMASSTILVNGNSFVWSPNATTTVSTSANDWTNGYQVLGLPSSGIIQTRSN